MKNLLSLYAETASVFYGMNESETFYLKWFLKMIDE